MNANERLERESILGRVTEFLKLHIPFQWMEDSALQHLAQTSAVTYFDQGQVIFQSGDELHDCIYVVRKGEVIIRDEEGNLIDQCAEGEIFGARALMNSEVYQADAVASPEALLIKLPVERVRSSLAADAKLTEFFFGDFSSGLALRKRKLAEINAEYRKLKQKAPGSLRLMEVVDRSSRPPVTCYANTSIKEAAQTMQNERVGSIIVVSEHDHPIGIVTNNDLRNKVATGKVAVSAEISAIMSSPVHTMKPGITSMQYLMEMLTRGVHHLCLTKTGSNEEPLIGVITDQDLIFSMGNNPVALIRSLRLHPSERKRTVDQFFDYAGNLVQSGYPVPHIAQMVERFNKELIEVCIDECLEKLSSSLSKNDFCWLALGSSGRGEQIIRTDLDSAFVHREGLKKSDLQALAKSVHELLESYGFQSDPAGIQADNLEWIKSEVEWIKTFQSWINTPDQQACLHATIFFDLMPFTGNHSSAESIQTSLTEMVKNNPRFIAFLAENALQNPPPTGFFKNFILERSGEHRNEFDIKARAMMPLADAARLRSLELGIPYPSSTIARYERLAEEDKIHAERYEDARVAYQMFMRLKAESGIKSGGNGRFISPSSMTTLEKQALKNAFAPIASLQHLIKPA